MAASGIDVRGNGVAHQQGPATAGGAAPAASAENGGEAKQHSEPSTPSSTTRAAQAAGGTGVGQLGRVFDDLLAPGSGDGVFNAISKEQREAWLVTLTRLFSVFSTSNAHNDDPVDYKLDGGVRIGMVCLLKELIHQACVDLLDHKTGELRADHFILQQLKLEQIKGASPETIKKILLSGYAFSFLLCRLGRDLEATFQKDANKSKQALMFYKLPQHFYFKDGKFTPLFDNTVRHAISVLKAPKAAPAAAAADPAKGEEKQAGEAAPLATAVAGSAAAAASAVAPPQSLPKDQSNLPSVGSTSRQDYTAYTELTNLALQQLLQLQQPQLEHEKRSEQSALALQQALKQRQTEGSQVQLALDQEAIHALILSILPEIGDDDSRAVDKRLNHKYGYYNSHLVNTIRKLWQQLLNTDIWNLAAEGNPVATAHAFSAYAARTNRDAKLPNPIKTKKAFAKLTAQERDAVYANIILTISKFISYKDEITGSAIGIQSQIDALTERKGKLQQLRGQTAAINPLIDEAKDAAAAPELAKEEKKLVKAVVKALREQKMADAKKFVVSSIVVQPSADQDERVQEQKREKQIREEIAAQTQAIQEWLAKRCEVIYGDAGDAGKLAYAKALTNQIIWKMQREAVYLYDVDFDDVDIADEEKVEDLQENGLTKQMLLEEIDGRMQDCDAQLSEWAACADTLSKYKNHFESLQTRNKFFIDIEQTHKLLSESSLTKDSAQAAQLKNFKEEKLLLPRCRLKIEALDKLVTELIELHTAANKVPSKLANTLTTLVALQGIHVALIAAKNLTSYEKAEEQLRAAYKQFIQCSGIELGEMEARRDSIVQQLFDQVGHDLKALARLRKEIGDNTGFDYTPSIPEKTKNVSPSDAVALLLGKVKGAAEADLEFSLAQIHDDYEDGIMRMAVSNASMEVLNLLRQAKKLLDAEKDQPLAWFFKIKFELEIRNLLLQMVGNPSTVRNDARQRAIMKIKNTISQTQPENRGKILNGFTQSQKGLLQAIENPMKTCMSIVAETGCDRETDVLFTSRLAQLQTVIDDALTSKGLFPEERMRALMQLPKKPQPQGSTKKNAPFWDRSKSSSQNGNGTTGGAHRPSLTRGAGGSR